MSSQTNKKRLPKKWQSYKDQVAILESRGMIFENKVKAEHVLSQINYYRLSGYWYPFRMLASDMSRDDDFINDTRFEDILNIYLFDKQLRLLCLQALESIEMSVRTNIAHTLGRISPIAHLNKDNFDQRFVKSRNGQWGYDKWLSKYHEQINRAKKSPFIEHHHSHYQHLPIWVGIEVLDFGSISVLYTGLKGKQQLQISKLYGVSNAKVFASWLRSLNYVRNICAHHGRLWNVNIDVIAQLDKNIPSFQNLDNKRIYFYLTMMCYLLKTISPSSNWEAELNTLLTRFPTPQNKAITLMGLGFV